MIVVGIDTSTRNLNLGIYSDKISLGRKYDSFRSNVEKIDRYLELLLVDTNLKIVDINGFSVTNGPGSYSGLRVGSAFIKGCGFQRGIDFTSISTVYAMAFHYRNENEKIGIVYDIKHGKLVFMDNKDFEETIIDENNIDSIDWNAYKLTGNGVKYLTDHLHIDTANILPNGISEPCGQDVAYAGFLALSEGKYEDLTYFEPRYFK